MGTGNHDVSNNLLMLLHITNGIGSYEINSYYSKLIKLGYVELGYSGKDDIKYVLSDKGKGKIKLILEKEINYEME